jgi:hypothetical protein
MKINRIILLLIIMVVTLPLSLFSRVHITDLGTEFPQKAIVPDVAGYVNIESGQTGFLPTFLSDRELPTVMDGFPLSYSNSNVLNGAVYIDMDGDVELEVIFGVGTKIVALNTDGSAVPNWPVNLSYYVWGSPAIGDITGDGNNEIVATSRNNTTGNEGELYAFHFDGTPVAGFPITQAGGGTMNASLADITGDGALEILVNVRNSPNGWVYVYDGTGAVVDGWPQDLDTFPGAGISSGDITGDGNNEVVALSYESLYVFDYQGNVLDGFPLSMPGITYSYSSPVLIDLDDDGYLEIVYGGCHDNGSGKVFVVKYDGSYLDGWPQDTEHWIFGTVSIADVNNDGDLDLIVGDQVGSTVPSDYIYAWDKDGNMLTGFPAGPTDAIYTQIGIVDITGDGNVNLIISSNLFAYGYDCYNHDGTHNDDWPLPCGTGWDSVTMQITPVFGDFTGDGNIEMAGAATGITSWIVELYLWSTGVEFNEELAYMIINGCNIRHDGVFAPSTDTPSIVIDPQSFDFTLYKNDTISTDLTISNEGTVDVDFALETDEDWIEALPMAGTVPAGEIFTIDIDISAAGLEPDIYNGDIVINYDSESIIVPVTLEVLPLPMPTDLAINNETGLFSWEEPDYDPSLELTEYEVYLDSVLVVVTEDTEYQYEGLIGGQEYVAGVVAVYNLGNSEMATINFNFIGVAVNDPLVIVTELEGNYPNPFNPETTISFSVAQNYRYGSDGSPFVTLEIFNIRGEKVKTLINEKLPAGNHQIIWNGKDDNNKSVSSGIYFYKMNTDEYSAIKRLILLR